MTTYQIVTMAMTTLMSLLALLMLREEVAIWLHNQKHGINGRTKILNQMMLAMAAGFIILALLIWYGQWQDYFGASSNQIALGSQIRRNTMTVVMIVVLIVYRRLKKKYRKYHAD